MNLRVSKLIFILALGVAWAPVEADADADAEHPFQVQPSSGSVMELRAMAAKAAETFGGYLD